MPGKGINGWQGVCLVAMLVLGGPALMGGNWAGLSLGLLLAAPAVLVYVRLQTLRPESDIFDTLVWAFGRAGGRAVSCLLALYALHAGAVVLYSFTGFVAATALPSTPGAAAALFLAAFVVWAAKSGTAALGRWSGIFLVLAACMLLLTVVLAIPYCDAANVLPVFEGGAWPVIDGGTDALALSFLDTVLILAALPALQKTVNPYRVYLGGLALGGGLLILSALRDALVLGAQTVSGLLYPAYTAAQVIALGDFFQRFEILLGVVFLLCAAVKAAVCLTGAARGAAAVLGAGDGKRLAAPTGLLMAALALGLFGSVPGLFRYLAVYKYAALVFQVVLPTAVWVAAELKSRGARRAPADAPPP